MNPSIRINNKFDVEFGDNPDYIDEEDTKYFAKYGKPIRLIKLINFKTNSSQLLYTHKSAIYDNVYIPLSQECHNRGGLNPFWINLLGYASKTGSPHANKELSLQRTESVKKEILNGGDKGQNKLQIAVRESISVGAEADPLNTNYDWGVYRCVRIYLHMGIPPPYIAPKPIASIIKRTFAMKLINQVSASIPVGNLGIDNYFFHIKDLDKKEDAIYSLTGPSVGVSLGKGSEGGEGDFTTFVLKSYNKIDLTDFDNLHISVISEPGLSNSSYNINIGGNLHIGISKIDNPSWLVREIEIPEIKLNSNAGTGVTLFSDAIGILKRRITLH